jgi:hypothetical protein
MAASQPQRAFTIGIAPTSAEACLQRRLKETKGERMDNDPEGMPPHSEHGSSIADATAVTASTPERILAPESRNGRRLIPFASLGIMTVGVGLAAFLAVYESATASTAVASALTNSLHSKSAAVATSVDISESGGMATVTSKGTIDFTTAASRQAVQIVSGNEHIGEEVVSDGSTIYVHLDGGLIAKVVSGKSWLSLPSGQSEASGVTGGGGTGNAAATLRVLSATGNDVSDLGPAQVDGQDAHLYSVHLTRSQINRDIAQEHLPEITRQAIAQVHVPAITYTLAINGANQLMQMRTSLHLKADGQQVTERLVERYSHYGEKVTVTAPPSHEVIPFQTFLQLALAKGVHVTV